MGISAGDGKGSMSEINVVPLVDIMLVLLIIFMVTAPLMSAGVDIDLPRTDGPALNTDLDDQLVLSIDRDLTFRIDDTAFPREEIGTRLAAIATANPDQPVFLRADGAIAYRHVARLLADARNAGFPRVGMVFAFGDEEEEE